MRTQKILPLTVVRRPGQQAWENKSENYQLRLISSGKIPKSSPDELFAALLKRHAREIMGCVTECEPVQIAVHLARLRDLEEIIRFAINHLQIPANECGRSDKQLISAVTIGDLLECIKITLTQHRAPECVTQRESDFQRLERKIDLIAGAIATNPHILEALFGTEKEGA
jgi:hypothetical protein